MGRASAQACPTHRVGVCISAECEKMYTISRSVCLRNRSDRRGVLLHALRSSLPHHIPHLSTNPDVFLRHKFELAR